MHFSLNDPQFFQEPHPPWTTYIFFWLLGTRNALTAYGKHYLWQQTFRVWNVLTGSRPGALLCLPGRAERVVGTSFVFTQPGRELEIEQYMAESTFSAFCSCLSSFVPAGFVERADGDSSMGIVGVGKAWTMRVAALRSHGFLFVFLVFIQTSRRMKLHCISLCPPPKWIDLKLFCKGGSLTLLWGRGEEIAKYAWWVHI